MKPVFGAGYAPISWRQGPNKLQSVEPSATPPRDCTLVTARYSSPLSCGGGTHVSLGDRRFAASQLAPDAGAV